MPTKSKQRVHRGIVGSTREEILAAIRGACDTTASQPTVNKRKRQPSKSRKTKPTQVMP